MEQGYRYTREEAIQILHDWREGADMPMVLIAEILLAHSPSGQDILWAYRIARKQGFMGTEIPCEPFYRDILALDT